MVAKAINAFGMVYIDYVYKSCCIDGAGTSSVTNNLSDLIEKASIISETFFEFGLCIGGKMKEYRYFITDESYNGTLISSTEFNGKAMILLVGNILQRLSIITVENTVAALVTDFNFSVLVKHIDKVTLNTSKKTPFTYYDLIDECGYCESDGYMYTDINRIEEYFSSEKSQSMLKSIKAFSKKPVS